VVANCRNDVKSKEAVEADMDRAEEAGIQGTPNSLIYKNGQLVDEIQGAQPFDVINAKLQDLLK
jgi:predicted DsbA family dithiol-disulfide isomerase